MRRLGKHERYAHRLTTTDVVFAETRDAVRALFDSLWDMPAPSRNPAEHYTARRARNHAARNGWVGPLSWDDDTIDDPNAAPNIEGELSGEPDESRVESAIRGEKPNLTAEERREVITRMHGLNWSASRLAEHLGCTPDTVQRIRRKLRLPPIRQADLEHAA